MTYRVGVPSGVGDCYWALTKIKAYRERHGIEHLTLAIQKSKLDRAHEWGKMTDLVDAVEYSEFTPGADALFSGVGAATPGLDAILWPNSVLDRGGRIETWMPELATDLNFQIKAPNMGESRAIVYASSDAINKSWMQGRGGDFWGSVIAEMAKSFGLITLVGSAWDQSLKRSIPTQDVEDLVGQTTLPEVAGLIRDARVFVGVICGLSILSNHFRTPCVALYPDWKFPPSFPTSWVALDAPYTALPVSSLPGPRDVARAAVAVVGSHNESSAR